MSHPKRFSVILAIGGTLFAQSLAAQSAAQALADIRDPVRFVPWLLVLASILAVLLTALALWLFIRYRRRQAATATVAPTIPPAEWARRELDRLESGSTTLDDKTFASGVADVLREYLERAFALPAPERTTEEFLQLVSGNPYFREDLKNALQTFLTRSDLVKFARQNLGAEMRGPIIAEAREVVREAEEQRQRASARSTENPPGEAAS